MKKLMDKRNDGEIASTIHMEFIQNLAEFSKDNGIEEVETYHRAIFLNHYGKDLERFQQQRLGHENQLEYLDAKLESANAKLVDLEKLIPVDEEGHPDVQPTAPWNLWDRAMFGAAFLGVCCLVIFGILNISFNLLESGIVTFIEHPIRAYFWAALLPVGALGVKVGWDFLNGPRLRLLYVWASLAIGLLGVLVWVGAYASIYPTLSKSTDEHIESLHVFDSEKSPESSLNSSTLGEAKQIDMIIVVAQAIAEIFLSAVLGIYMTMLYLKHRPVRLASNPEFIQLDEERARLEEIVSRERLVFAEAKGNEVKLQNQLSVFVAYAKSLFQKEVSVRKDQGHQKRQMLDNITEQLKSQLDAAENGEYKTRHENSQHLALDHKDSR
ncbi:MAG TPA: hypothetical protein EYQ50_29270 [Verrucomicrobiales bacterium]|nr:hypothetical protein [Verrucomicrobiales bacterium]